MIFLKATDKLDWTRMPPSSIHVTALDLGSILEITQFEFKSHQSRLSGELWTVTQDSVFFPRKIVSPSNQPFELALVFLLTDPRR